MTDALKLPFAGEDIVRRLSTDLDEPKWLREDRVAALASYLALPIETNSLFTLYVDLRQARFAEIQPYPQTGAAQQVADTLPEGAAALIEVAEDEVVARALSAEARDAGIVIDTFTNVLKDRPELIRAAIDAGQTLPADDKFAQFARSHWALGLLIHVPRNVILDKPIVVRWATGRPGRGLVSRTLIDVGENASVSVLEEQLPSNESVASTESVASEAQSLWWGTTEVRLAQGASLNFAGQQDFGPNTLAFVNRHADLEQDAQLTWALASVGAALHKSRIDNRLVGRGSGVRQVEIGFGGGRQLFDATSYTRHIGADTTGDLLSKGVFLDRARGYYKGMITIEKTATGTDSFLGEFAMLMSKQARSVTIPSLEIDQPNVRRASHASSVGPVDETQVFYLMSRGLPREIARKFIVMGFLEPVVSRIPLGDAQDRLRRLLEQKWPESTEHPETKAAALTSEVRRVVVGRADELEPGTMKMIQVDGTDILIVHQASGNWYATQGICTHEYFELDKGFLTNGTLTCALHLSRFDLETGEALDPPAELPLALYPVTVEDGDVVLELPEGPIPINE